MCCWEDEEEERKKKEMKEAAKKELEEWYKHHKEAIDKTRSANRLVLVNISYSYFLLYPIYFLMQPMI